MRKVEQNPRNKPVENDMRTKASRKPPRKTNMRTEVPKKTEENDMSTEAPKKHRNRRKHDMRTGHLDKNIKKRYENRSSGKNRNKLYVNRGSEKKQKKKYMRTGAPATTNPDKTI